MFEWNPLTAVLVAVVVAVVAVVAMRRIFYEQRRHIDKVIELSKGKGERKS